MRRFHTSLACSCNCLVSRVIRRSPTQDVHAYSEDGLVRAWECLLLQSAHSPEQTTLHTSGCQKMSHMVLSPIGMQLL